MAADGTASAAWTSRGALNDQWTLLRADGGELDEASTVRQRGDDPRRLLGRAGDAMCKCSATGTRSTCLDEYQDFSTGFQSQVGFIQTSNIRSDHTHATYQWFPKHSVVQSFGLETNQNIAFDHQGNRVYHYTTFDPFCAAAAQHRAGAASAGRTPIRWGRRTATLLTRNENFTENFGGVCGAGRAVGAVELQPALRSGAAM